MVFFLGWIFLFYRYILFTGAAHGITHTQIKEFPFIKVINLVLIGSKTDLTDANRH